MQHQFKASFFVFILNISTLSRWNFLGKVIYYYTWHTGNAEYLIFCDTDCKISESFVRITDIDDTDFTLPYRPSTVRITTDQPDVSGQSVLFVQLFVYFFFLFFKLLKNVTHTYLITKSILTLNALFLYSI